MTSYSHATAPTTFVEVESARIAYRSFGVDKETPVALLDHYRAGMDHWDPLVTDGLARYAELAAITQPTLVVHGHHDIMQPPVDAYTLAQRIPRAQLIIYPDSGRGAIFQYPGLFVDHAARFLDAEPAFT